VEALTPPARDLRRSPGADCPSVAISYENPIGSGAMMRRRQPRSVRLEALVLGVGYRERPSGRTRLERSVGPEFAGFLLSLLGVTER
jgi:hypothetical protein